MSHPSSGRRSRVRTAVVAAASVLVTTLGLMVGTSPSQAATPPARDGLSAYTAAASCFEIKQNDPNSANGIYWLQTPVMQAPDQFYCDQTSQGGGWVLVGRGREGWRTEYEGLRTPAEIRNTPSGQGAFVAAQLPSATIDGLLNGGRVDALTDNIRIRRAKDAAGTTWQEGRYNFASRDRWVWSLWARHQTKNVSFDGVNASNGLMNNFGSDNSFRRVNTDAAAAQGYTIGFAYGANITGTNSASSYLWSNTTGTGAARPFTQMFLRPRLTKLSFPPIADSGTPVQQRSSLAETKALPTVWGVNGLASNNGETGEMRTEVQAFAQIDGYMYVGGNFRYVQRNAAGLDRVEQSYLAAFNVTTGEWLPSFRPTFNNQVKSLAALPNGRLAVGGEFTQANGRTANALVALDPLTGETDLAWKASVENRLTTGVLAVKSLTVSGGYLYAGGSFTHLAGGTRTSAVYARGAARLSVTDGTPDPGWNPNFNGVVNTVSPSADGARMYAAGYFTLSNSATATKAAAIQTVAGAPLVPWTPTFSSTYNFQFTVLESGARVWLGGSEHSWFSYDRDALTIKSGNISLAGGDFQTSTAARGNVYAGCHCNDWLYSDSFTWSNPGTAWTQADKLGIVGAWDATTGRYQPEFDPITNTRGGHGAWAAKGDSRGTLWLGGSYDSSVNTNGAVQWSGGFVRFADRDTQAPTTPSNLTLSALNGELKASWTAASDNDGAPRYELLLDDRVVAVTSTTSATIPLPEGEGRYFVRAVDDGGNRSASTAVKTFSVGAGDPVAIQETLVANGAQWSWKYDANAVPSGWQTAAFDDSTWTQSPAPLGFGSTLVATVISTGPTTSRQLSAQFRRSFVVPDPTKWDTVTVTAWVDDGAVIYLNGTEIGRANLPAGTITPTTYATAAPRTTTARTTPVVVTVPADLLTAGTNILAVQTHLNYKSTPDASMEAKLVVDGQQ